MYFYIFVCIFGLLAHAGFLNNLCIKYLAISQRPLTVYFIKFMKKNKKQISNYYLQ